MSLCNCMLAYLEKRNVLPYHRKLTLVLIKVFEINGT